MEQKTFSVNGDIYVRGKNGVRHYPGLDEFFYYVNGKFVGTVTREQGKNIVRFAHGKHEIVYGINNFNVIIE